MGVGFPPTVGGNGVGRGPTLRERAGNWRDRSDFCCVSTGRWTRVRVEEGDGVALHALLDSVKVVR